MASERDIARELRYVTEEWERITSSPERPRSLMNVIEYGLGDKRRGEVYVTQFLRYLLDRSEPHGMGEEFLEAFLEGFRTKFAFEEPINDLSNVRVRNEVWIRDRSDPATSSVIDTNSSADGEGDDSSGRVDLVVDKPGDWFLVIELKFSAEENNLSGAGYSQTEFYRNATHVSETPKTDYEGNGYHLFVHERGTDQARSEDFANWTWEEFTDEVLVPFIDDLGSTLPHRTLVHLQELRDDIETFTDMASDDSHADEKVELYLEHYPVLNDLHQEFEDRWAEFTDQWNTRVAASLQDDVDSFHTVDDGIVAIDLDHEDTESTWYLRAKHKDWQQFYLDGWFRPADREQWESGGLESLHDKSTDHDTFRIFYHHRMQTNRTAAIEDGTLIVTFRNAGANPEPFHDIFSETIDARESEILDQLPESAEMLGQKSDQFEVRFDIPDPDSDDESVPDDFFEAYVWAVRSAFVNLVLQKPDLTKTLSEVYDEALEDHMCQL